MADGAQVAGASSPRADRLARPRWRDARLAGGVLLVLLAVVLGARVVAAADDSVAVWSVTKDLAAGSVVGPGDLRSVDVRLGEVATAYVGVGSAPQGWVAIRPLAAGELLPVDALAPTGEMPDLRTVTLAVERFHAPADLARGQLVDVYATAEDAPTTLVVTQALVSDVIADGGRLGPAGDGVGVALSVPPDQVTLLVQAVQDGSIDLVRVASP